MSEPYSISHNLFFFTLYPWGTGTLIDLQNKRELFFTRHELRDIFTRGAMPKNLTELSTIIPLHVLNAFFSHKDRNQLNSKVRDIERQWLSDWAYLQDECGKVHSIKSDEFKREIFLETTLDYVLKDTVNNCKLCPVHATWDTLGYIETEGHKQHVLVALDQVEEKHKIVQLVSDTNFQRQVTETCTTASEICLAPCVFPTDLLNFLSGDPDFILLLIKERLFNSLDPEVKKREFTLALRSYLSQNKFSYLRTVL